MPDGRAQQGLERRHGGAASVEAEDEFVDVVGQVLGADAVVGAEQPGLEVGEARRTCSGRARAGAAAATPRSPACGW